MSLTNIYWPGGIMRQTVKFYLSQKYNVHKNKISSITTSSEFYYALCAHPRQIKKMTLAFRTGSGLSSRELNRPRH